MHASAVYNFAAGPGVMPREVLLEAQRELLDCRRSGMSILEMPFTGEAFQDIADQARRDLRELVGLPPNYRVLFLPGGASTQFSLLPMNLLPPDGRADYVDSGHWSRKAIAEARRYVPVNVAASGARYGYRRLPCRRHWRLDPGAGYCHITSNETADGLAYHRLPDTRGVPLVADMTSDFLSRPLDIERFGVIYAGAQKNIGPAGLTLVIIRDDLLRAAWPACPTAFSYRVQVDSDNRFNTPPTQAIYLAGLVFRWLRSQGGLGAMAARNRRKSEALYAFIDASDFYACAQRVADRSRMNVCFHLAVPSLTAEFVAQARRQGLLNLQGHAAVGGLRASLYNAMPEAGVEALIAFMAAFAARHGRSRRRCG
ncbi:3-phosphoserine/phosphohydroxythreonine transaminase [Halomonas sp. MCCC 1A17488]|uniref:3-phosphoserine/phosphohydroxythreonine transaminase n=1 Tax=unclassified Halomonas TaxID=2609666 RepID=UPI0018D23DE2|nr:MULTISPECIES: 3-phosphoserine/phosphohydroxythreonine transaminase [unclassified Halomonas]MCE8017989.1 3-phosphoserine/phosphohydroxythreonine transaminase [Halomonas sp. MCCC 1A17488]MCG3241322.1 3-phosphoserine/phosphohydroxythreonine transaminase [Halomonas sp. MCCC 1A17488]QPP48712.1 3-phosphoserine/phosphohydroxythreonine transaminase [Halomonas sp. SS10-MC5]